MLDKYYFLYINVIIRLLSEIKKDRENGKGELKWLISKTQLI